MGRFQRALLHIDKVTEIVAICLFVALTGIVGIEVFRRYLIGVSFPWSDELARYLMIWVAFLGIGLGCRRERHVGFFVVVNLLPQGLRGVISIFLRCSIMVFLTLVGLGFYRILPVLAIETSPSLGVSMFWFYLAVPVMCLLYILHIIVSLIQDLQHGVQGEIESYQGKKE
jgi:TRAP-type C4-dicarboxylate transport system permease small subunit